MKEKNKYINHDKMCFAMMCLMFNYFIIGQYVAYSLVYYQSPDNIDGLVEVP